MSDFGIKISKEGFDVRTATATNIIYSSKWSNFKIHSILTQAVVTASGIGTTSTTVDNPLTYAPFFMPFVEDTTYESGFWYEAKTWGGIMDDSGAVVNTVVSYNSSTNKFTLTVKTFANWDGGTLTFKIVVFTDIVTGTPTAITTTGDYGVKVSKEGSDVEEVDSEMSFSTKFRNLTVYDSSATTTTSAGGYVRTITHNLGYVPIVTAYQRLPSPTTDNQRLPSFYNNGVDLDVAYLKVSSTQLVITDGGYTGNPDINYQYIIFNEQLTT